jgi:hypothetical protein
MPSPSAPSRDPGITGGRVTRDDFLGTAATDAELTRVRQQSEAESAMSLDDQAASLTSGAGRSERDMLIAIQNGELPRFIARVGPSSNFDRGTFANPNRPFAFAAEPADLRGLAGGGDVQGRLDPRVDPAQHRQRYLPDHPGVAREEALCWERRA